MIQLESGSHDPAMRNYGLIIFHSVFLSLRFGVVLGAIRADVEGEGFARSILVFQHHLGDWVL